MPAKNIVKEYFEDAYYHVYNRGVEKRIIFLDDQDCHVFLRYIKLYLSPLEEVEQFTESEGRQRRFKNLNLQFDVDLLCFALMPNHFHLLLKNKTQTGIKTFMQRLMTAYVMYFNKKYQRVGSLFQNTYKAAPVLHDSYMLHLSRYIHKNSAKVKSSDIAFKNYSSFYYYVGDRVGTWLKKEMIFSYFQNTVKPSDFATAYKAFVDTDITDSINLLSSQNLLFEEGCI